MSIYINESDIWIKDFSERPKTYVARGTIFFILSRPGDLGISGGLGGWGLRD